MTNIKTRKVALVGAGAVGTSFLYSAMNRSIADEYGIIDVNVAGAEGNKLDLEDAVATNLIPWKTSVYTYKDLKDVDVLVVTAGRPQKPGETRLEMVADNAKIMKFIAEEVKKSAFTGITIIASNPVDVLTFVYQEVTGFDASRVIGSGTSLDSARLRWALSEKIGIAPQSIEAYVLGEHGDSSVSAFSSASVGGKPLAYFLKQNKVSGATLAKMHKDVYNKAYEIIDRKRATFYGIGSALANLVEAVLRNKNEVMACGAKLDGEYGFKGFYIGTAAVIGSNGIKQIVEIDMDVAEKAQFKKSAEVLKESIKKAFDAADIKIMKPVAKKTAIKL